MTIKHLGGIFGRNPTFEDVIVDNRVGIGADNPEAALTVTPESGNFNATYNSYDGVGLFLRGNGTAGSGNYGPALVFGSADSDGTNQENKHSAISMVQTGGDANQTGLAFFVHRSDASTADLEEAVRIASDKAVGIGTINPSETLTVSGNIQIEDDDAYLQFKDTNAGADDKFRRIYHSEQNLYISRRNDNGTLQANDLVIDASGNLLLGGITTPASSDGNLVMFNGTAPTGSVTNGIVLYAEDVSASSELKVRDEAGNVTTLSPHNFELIPEGPSEDMAWSYYSEKDGKRINVDMLKAIRVLEKMSGEQLVYED